MFRIQSKPIRTVLGWQVIATVVLTLLAGVLAGVHGALSAALGGVVSLGGGLAFALVAGLSGRSKSAEGSIEGALLGALRAEAAKVGVIVLLLWAVFALYQQLVAAAFLASFVGRCTSTRW